CSASSATAKIAKSARSCRRRAGCSARSGPGPVRAAALVLLAGWSAGCTGFMQAPLPEHAASYARRWPVEELCVGAAEADITPTEPPWLAGFDLGRRATEIGAPLKARALVFAFGAQRVAIVGIDNLGLQR